MTPVVAASGRKLAINRLRERRPLDAAAVDRFLARNEVPIVEGARCTFLFRGEADEVFVVHRIFGLPDHLPMRRLHGTDLWYAVLELPSGSREITAIASGWMIRAAASRRASSAAACAVVSSG